MNADNPPLAQERDSGEKKREDLLSELESIRHLLSDNAPTDTSVEPKSNGTPARIPVLIPDDSIPTLGREHRHRETHATQARKIPARISNESLPSSVLLSSKRSRENLVDDVVRSAMPRLEAILRELVQEALLQDKLRGGKR